MNWKKHYSKKPYIGQTVTNKGDKYIVTFINDNGKAINIRKVGGNHNYSDIIITTFEEFK